jgi:hypothetical protein
MSLSPSTDFDETSTTSAEFDAQKTVLANSTIQSADVNVLVEKALRRTKYLDNIKVDIAGDTMTGLLTANAGITVASGQDLTLNGVSVQGVVGFSTLGRVWLAGRKQLWRSRVTLSDAAHTVDVEDGDRFSLPPLNAAPRIITLDSTTIVPEDGETLTFFWNPSGTIVTGTQYTIRRDAAAGSTVIATFVGAETVITGAVYAEFEFVDGTGWKLGTHSGTPSEYFPVVPGPESLTPYGVVPGAGA